MGRRPDGRARETFERTVASVMGKRMFDLGEQAWPPIRQLVDGHIEFPDVSRRSLWLAGA